VRFGVWGLGFACVLLAAHLTPPLLLPSPRFSLSFADAGEVYVWGNGGNGRLGLGSADTVMVPTLLVNHEAHSAPLQFQSVHCGSMHTIGVSRSGAVFTWGCNGSGQLGHGDRKDLLSPRRVDVLAATPVSQVDAGFDYSAALTGVSGGW